MTWEQLILFALLLAVFVLLIWGRWRYDLVAFGALLVALVAGVIPAHAAFSGFGHPATVIVALVLVVSRGLSNSGAVELLARYVVDSSRKVGTHIGVMSSVGAVLSALMNNVATLALLMPIDIQAAKKAGRSAAVTLMPLSFATILGGMITLIGTPPNIVIAQFRSDALGEAFRMFDFAPVGLACAAAGVLFVALVGWRLLPSGRAESDAGTELFRLADYIAELKVPEGSAIVGRKVRDLDEDAATSDVEVLGLIRLQANPDAFLMAVAVGSSSAFLTPIGHKNNTLIMGPGGYRFGDYWRMGLPLEVLVIAVATPAILTVWPL